MDIKKADYFTVVQFGNLELLQKKIFLQKDSIEMVKNLCDNNNISILEKSLAFRKFDIAKYLLENNVTLNVISKSNRNELHYIAANVNEDKAITISKMLIERKVDLNLKDKKFGNSPFWYFCQEAMRIDSFEVYEFIKFCIIQKPDMDYVNNAGNSIREMIFERQNDILINIIGEEAK